MYVVFCTCPSLDVARKIGKSLVEDKLVACVNLLEVKESIYFWEGKVVHDPEVLMIMKSPKKKFEKLESRVKELHPYSVPEIVALSPLEVNKDYFNWLNSCCP